MHRFLPLLLVVLLGCASETRKNGEVIADATAKAVLETETFAFEVGGQKLVGLLDRPVGQEPVSTIILVHGYGGTDVVAGNWFYNLRSRFARIGMNTLVWDKPGQGQSEGEFDINQPVESSAEEVIAAVHALQEREIAGAETIGVWGVSRAGWIVPLAMQKEPDIAFWISVSGTDDKENGRYLLETNFPIEGRSAEETEVLVAEWQARFNTVWQNGTYEQYVAAGPNLKNDPFMQLIGWAGDVSEEDFYAYQARFQTGELTVDAEAELQVYIPGFRSVLAAIDKPVLALFGERDANVDWRKTMALYEETIGANPNASLDINVFPNANHSLRQCEMCGVREMRTKGNDMPFAEGYYDAMHAWLIEQGFGHLE